MKSTGMLSGRLLAAALLLAACGRRPPTTNAPSDRPSAGGVAPAEASLTPPPTITLTLAPMGAPSDTAAPPPQAATATRPPSEAPRSPSATAPADTAQPAASPTPVPPDSTQSPGVVKYVVYSEQFIGEYAARIWVQADYPFPNQLSLGTIDRGQTRLVQLSEVSGFEPLPGADLTGEGQPDVAFALRWGGSHCCWGTVLYNLGDTPQQVLWVGGEVGVGKFRDLDNDGDWEFITRDVVAGLPCSQPSSLAVLAYGPGLGYAPASPLYPAVFEPEIVDITALAEQRAQQNGALTQCDVADLMLDYLYSGQTERGAAEFARLYTAPDAAAVWAALEAAARGGRLYLAPAN
ncbi:MAG: hypothetical protein IT317_08090 [Anaerolineales bacterium]|nr:hypothetical protein [Anaerolineales bacterium]